MKIRTIIRYFGDMPLAFIKDINHSVSYALWQIAEPLENMAESYPFTEADRSIFDAQKVESRKGEWLAARLALRSLLEARGLEDSLIHKDEFGKPHLINEAAYISISHTKGWGAAAIGTKAAVGIDIEFPRPQVQRIARKFLHSREAVWTQDDMNRLTQIWCAKEALYKLHGRTQLIFAEQLLIDPNPDGYPAKGSICENGGTEDHPLHYDLIEELYLCLAH